MAAIVRLLCGLGLMTVALLVGVPAAQATPSILVAQCGVSDPCYTSNSVTPWSFNLSGAQLTSLGLGADVSLIAGQTAPTIIRLGMTTIDFTTSGSPVTDTLPEFNGSSASTSPCTGCYLQVDTVGDFTIPLDATSAVISGTFGNSLNTSSAAVCLFLGSLGSCTDNRIVFGAAVPEPFTLSVFGAGLVGAAVARRRKKAVPA